VLVQIEAMMEASHMLKELLIVTIFPGAMALAAVSDLYSMRIPNRLTLALGGGFFVVAPLIGLGWGDLGIHIALALLALALALVPFCFGWIGGGDVKLFAATCLWLGPNTITAYSVYVGLLGGALTLLLLLWRSRRLPAMLSARDWLARLHNPKEGVPYGIALAAAGLSVYPSTPFFAAIAN
jgi:prepilin peptidase CpaA